MFHTENPIKKLQDDTNVHVGDKNVVEKIEREKIHEQIFMALITEKLLSEFEDDLYDVVDDDEKTDAVLETINAYTSEEQKHILAIPASIRKRRLEAVYKKTQKGNLFDAQSFVKELLNYSKEQGFTLGYHISPYKISKDGNDWCVRATDFDDRDDRPMAYYSLDYKNLFRKRRGEYLYVVRAETGPQSTHKKDNTNNWGRANSLSIITSLPLQRLDEKVEKLYSKQNSQMKKAA